MSFHVGVDADPSPLDLGLAAKAGTAVATTSMHTRPARTDTRTGVPLRFRCATTSLPPSLAKAILRALPICVKSTETSFHVAIPDVPDSLGVTRESTSGLLPSLLPWTNGQCP